MIWFYFKEQKALYQRKRIDPGKDQIGRKKEIERQRENSIGS